VSLLARIRNVFRPADLAREIDEELQFHVDMRAREYASRGVPPDEARARALQAFGNPLLLRERTRDANVWVGLDTFLQDVRQSFRMLRRSPALTAAATVTLALGIGANTGVFSVVDAVIVRPLPYPDPDRLLVLYQQHERADVGRTRAAALDFLDWQARARSFASMAGYVGTGFTLTGGQDPELVIGQLVSAELFDVLGVRPQLGRAFRAEEAAAGRDRVMVLGHALWQRRFGGDRSVVGRTVMANGQPYTVVGVMPPGFDYPEKRYQLWAPLPLQDGNSYGLPVNRHSRYLQVVGRLRPGVTPERAAAELDALGRRLSTEFPDSNADTTIRSASLTEETVGAVRPTLLLVLLAAALVLLVACANVTSLLLARASARRREMALRSALGAAVPRLIRRLLTETLVLFAVGLAAGLALAHGTLWALRRFGPTDIPRLDEAALDGRAFLFAVLVVAATALVFGLAPALQAARSGAAGASSVGGSRVAGGTPPQQRLRSAVVVVEIGLAMALLTAAGLVGRSFLALQAVDNGFAADSAVTFGIALPPARFPDERSMRAFHRQLLDRLAAQPLFESVGTTTALPLSGQDLENGVTLEGAEAGQETPVAGLHAVSPGYLRAMGIPLRRGRAFTDRDREDAAAVAIVNETFARQHWPRGDALGKRLRSDDPWRTVVGIVGDVRHRHPERAPRPLVLVPYAQLEPVLLTTWARGASVVIRSSAEPSLVIGTARSAVLELDPLLPLIDVRPMRDLVSDATAQPRFRALLMGTLALIAAMLSLVGVFGVISYYAEQRSQEIGVRMALGARRAEVLALVLGRGARLALLGVLLGLAGGVALSRSLSGLLFEVSPTDPAVFALAATGLAVAALLASYLPARRAAHTDPGVALRER
jgi:putative ABC transport system permease protein